MLTKPLKPSLPNTEQSLNISLLMNDISYKSYHIAQTDKHVIIIGESGSGKKFFAKNIHRNSNRAEGPFHIFYCVDIKEEDYKDAFWEQLQFDDEHLILRYDAIERASFGILYLDQFSDLPDSFMFNIINSFTKGCNQIFRYDKKASPRLILSIKQNVYQRLLKTDIWDVLLQQLDPICIMLPPLRDHKEDIPALIDSFILDLQEESEEFRYLNLAPDVLNEFMDYNWPGNIRQLKNVLKQGAILSNGNTIERHHLPSSILWELPHSFQPFQNSTS